MINSSERVLWNYSKFYFQNKLKLPESAGSAGAGIVVGTTFLVVSSQK